MHSIHAPTPATSAGANRHEKPGYETVGRGALTYLVILVGTNEEHIA